MPSNLQVKIKVDSFPRAAARKMGAHFVSRERQRDCYYALGALRIKTRNDRELIIYERPDVAGSRKSNYVRIPVKRLPFKPLRVVDKVREYWRYKHTRIYFDRVRRLGSFVELETELPGGRQREFVDVLAHLGLSLRDGIPGSYSDL